MQTERELDKLRNEVAAEDAPLPPPPLAGFAYLRVALVVLVVGGDGDWVLVHEATPNAARRDRRHAADERGSQHNHAWGGRER